MSSWDDALADLAITERALTALTAGQQDDPFDQDELLALVDLGLRYTDAA